jgi:hypothetical protein
MGEVTLQAEDLIRDYAALAVSDARKEDTNAKRRHPIRELNANAKGC